MFPEFKIEEMQEVSASGKTSFLFDFKKGDFAAVDGKLVKAEGLDALKVWIEKVLRTERFKFKIYESGEYGITLSDFINADYPLDFVKVEIEREVREALLKNPDIHGVHSFAFERIKRVLHCTFTVNSKYGQVGGEISL